MSQHTGVSVTTLSRAAAGERLPSAAVTRAVPATSRAAAWTPAASAAASFQRASHSSRSRASPSSWTSRRRRVWGCGTDTVGQPVQPLRTTATRRPDQDESCRTVSFSATTYKPLILGGQRLLRHAPRMTHGRRVCSPVASAHSRRNDQA
ncbi:hypothetical protein [Streptomyces canus]|uniref:hypothetical protein n=1 Tax=Streptomyces canus TaxID=58343 RepID=UPI0030DE0BA8